MGDQPHGERKRFLESLTREQKLTVGVLLVCGVIAFVLAAVQVNRALNRPFTASLDEFVAFQRSLGPSDAQKMQQQQETDTDGDGISDWQELNVYHTSPYLADTDSDGVPDNIEIARGTDPNCPEGQTCSGSFVGTDFSTSTAPTASDFVGAPSSTAPSGPGVPPRDPASIRQFLKMRGMTDSDLAQYSDAALLKAYDAAANGNGAAGSAQKQTLLNNAGSPTQP